MSWIHKGQAKNAGSKSANLALSRISKSDAGMYTCRANNSAGSTEKQLNVVVNCEYILNGYFILFESILCTSKEVKTNAVSHVHVGFYLILNYVI